MPSPRCRSAASRRRATRHVDQPTGCAAKRRCRADLHLGARLAASQTTVRLDGMMLNSMCGDGQVQSIEYRHRRGDGLPDDGRECRLSGAGISVKSSQAGRQHVQRVRPRHGRDRTWKSDNLTQDLISRDLKATDKIDHNYDIEGGQGGRLLGTSWVFGSGRRISVNSPIAGHVLQGRHTGRRRPVSAERPVAPHVANISRAISHRVRRQSGQVPRTCDERRLRPDDGSHVWVSPPLRRVRRQVVADRVGTS